MDSEHEAERVAAFVAKGNFHAAYNIVLSALNACRKEGDQAGVERFLTIIKGIIAEMESEFGSQ